MDILPCDKKKLFESYSFIIITFNDIDIFLKTT